MNSRRYGVLAVWMIAIALVPAIGNAETEVPEEATLTHLQGTYIWQRKPAFPAQYSGANSLSPDEEKRSYSFSATAYLGIRTWTGGELYFNPEMVMSQSLSDLRGMGGLTNGENQKGGGPDPTFYVARLFVRQTWGLGGASERVESAPNQMAGSVDKRRLVVTVGKISLIDVFDGNSFAHDPRTQFLNWALIAHGAFDFAADERGYTIGMASEYYHDDWVLRAGRFEQPKESNGLPLDSRIMAHHGDQIEVEHDHNLAGREGKIRLLAFRNEANMGAFQDALDYWEAHGRQGVPDVSNVRKNQAKTGYGISMEQYLTPNAGLFARVSRNDGRTETYAFAEIEQSTAVGALLKGEAWGRPGDVAGIAVARNGLSRTHREYLANGGLGFFLGDGRLNYRNEVVTEAYYSLQATQGMWLSLDYQRIVNPAYNADRGPVRVFGARLHLEY